jgi:hypothetical protein
VAELVANFGGVFEPAESISNICVLELPTFGVCTVSVAVPAFAIAEAGTCAVSSVALTYCVERAVESQYTVDEAVKPTPLTVNANAAEPADSMAGDRLLMPTTGKLML